MTLPTAIKYFGDGSVIKGVTHKKSETIITRNAKGIGACNK